MTETTTGRPVIRDESLGTRAKVLWLWFRNQEEDKGRTRFTQPELMRVLKVRSTNTLLKDVRSLEEHGYLQVDRSVRPNNYRTI